MSVSLKSRIRHRVRRWRFSVADARQMRHAENAYAAIVASRPDRAVSPKEQARIRDYARAHFGSIKYSSWLIAYAAWRGEFVEGCLPDNYVGQYLGKATRAGFPSALERTLAGRVLQTDLFPDVAMVLRGNLYDMDGELLAFADAAKALFQDHPYLYLKQSRVSQGRGVARVRPETFEAAVQQSKTAVLQYPLSTHPALRELSPKAAATLRVTTVSHTGHVRAVAAYLRVARATADIVRSDEHIRACVSLETGKITDQCADPSWRHLERHPDTGMRFEGTQIPAFQDALETCVRLHAKVPQLWYIGWDVAITATGEIRLFEANNGHSDVKFSEACHGPIFAGLGWDRLHLS